MRAIKMVLTGMVAAVAVLSAQADLLIGWDSGGGINYAINAPGISGNLYTSNAKTQTDGNSSDGTFGSEFGGAAVTNSGISWAVGLGTNTVEGSINTILGINVVNNTEYDVVLDKLHFDAARLFAGSPPDLTLIYQTGSLGVAGGTVINSVVGLEQQNKYSDYRDFDWSLTGLADYTLAPGENALFRLIASNGTGGGFTYIDNIGISGTVMIPEPATIGMLGLGALVAMGMRRSRRS